MPPINLKKNILLSGGFRIVVLLLSFVFSWISARYLGVELKGKFSYFITLGGFIWIVLDLGLYRSFPFLVRKFPEKVSSMFAWIVLCFASETIILGLLGFSLLDYWSRISGFYFSSIYMLCFIGFITLTKAFMQLQSLFMGLDKIMDHSIAHFLNTIVGLTLLIVGYLFFRDSDRLLFLLVLTVVSIISSFCFLLFRHNWGFWIRDIDFKFIFKAYGFGIRVFLSSLFILLLLKADILIVRRMLGFSDVGIYSIAAHIVDLLQVASNMVGGLLLVKLSDTEDMISKWHLMKKMLMVFFVLLSLSNIGFIIVGKFILAYMFGKQFVPVYYTYLWLIPASYGLSFGSLFNNYLNSKGFPVISIVLPALALIVNIGLNLLLIPVLGIYGSALATSIAYSLWFIFIIAYEQKSTKGVMLHHLKPSVADWKELYQMGIAILAQAKQRLINSLHHSENGR
ncbi:MAG: polysaccharide biosynthesis C-terminal domain-containing protein [Candidatus Cloacimonetes bacterium]|nr:polysaccharide biosynthesis C-terminal domain-containing protein [Candidatus Cloacimonadota bacterium]